MGCGNMSQGSLGQEAVKMVVLPAYSTGAMSQKFLPLLRYLSAETGYEVQYISGSSYQGLGAAAQGAGADFALCDPLSFLILQRTHGARLMVMGMAPVLGPVTKGVLIAREDCGEAQMLRGRTVACVSQLSSEGFVSQAAALAALGLLPNRDYKTMICGTMEEVVRTVQQGKAEAGFVAPGAVSGSCPAGVRVLLEGEPVPNWVCVNLKPGNEEIESKIKQAFLRLNPLNQEQQQILLGLGYEKFTDQPEGDFKKLEKEARDLKVPF